MADPGAGNPENVPFVDPQIDEDNLMFFIDGNGVTLEDLNIEEPIFHQSPPIVDPIQDQDPIFHQSPPNPDLNLVQDPIFIHPSPIPDLNHVQDPIFTHPSPFPGPIQDQDPILTQPTPFPEQSIGTGSPDCSFQIPGVWGMNANADIRNPQAPETTQIPIPGESSTENEFQLLFQPEAYQNSIVLSEWPPKPAPFSCSCCQVLREIIHTNGMEYTTLQIHGNTGNVFHGILDTKLSTDEDAPSHHYRMFDFSDKKLEYVKEFVVHYCNEKRENGYFIINDPTSAFYETLCIGFAWAESLYNPLYQPSSSNQEAGNASNQENLPKLPLSIQRQRTGKMTLKDVGNYFHLPIQQAAKKMRICPTVVKKICRREGMDRWPHRKIRSLEKQMENWGALLGVTNPDVRIRAYREIERIQQEMDQIKQGARAQDKGNQGAEGN